MIKEFSLLALYFKRQNNATLKVETSSHFKGDTQLQNVWRFAFPYCIKKSHLS